MTPQAYSYVRFSSKRQERGDSFRRQMQIALEWYRREIAPLGLPLSDLKADDGFSAYKGAHVSKGSLGHFLAEIKAGNIAKGSILIAENLDRISRQGPKIARKIIEEVVDNGVDMHIVNIAVKLTYGWENTHLRYPVDAELERAWKESLYKSDRVGKAWQNKKEKAVDGLAITRVAPAWLTVPKVGAKPVVIGKRAATVRRIFALAGMGMGCKRIVRTLLSEGHPSFDNGKKRGKAWSPEYVQKILSNRAVLGEYQPHKLVDGKRVPVGEPILDYFPTVVSFEEWQAARESVNAKNRYRRASGKPGTGGGRVSVNSIFNPLVRDETNGGVTMVYHCKKGDKPYLTSKYTDGKKKANRLRYDKFESAFLNFLSDLDWQSVAGESESEEEKAARAELETVLGEIDRTEIKLRRLEAIEEEGLVSKSLYESLDRERARQSEYTAKRESLAAAVAMARSKAAALHSPEELLDAIGSGAPELRLKLKAEIRKRISSIDLSFGLDGFDTVADVKFINGAIRGIFFKDEHVFLVRGEGQI